MLPKNIFQKVIFLHFQTLKRHNVFKNATKIAAKMLCLNSASGLYKCTWTVNDESIGIPCTSLWCLCAAVKLFPENTSNAACKVKYTTQIQNYGCVHEPGLCIFIWEKSSDNPSLFHNIVHLKAVTFLAQWTAPAVISISGMFHPSCIKASVHFVSMTHLEERQMG